MQLKNRNMNNETRLRNSNVELLRILLLFGICVWHVIMHGADYKNIGTREITYPISYSVIVAFLVPCVDIFVLLSGYYLVKLRVRTILKFELQALFYSIIISGTILIIKDVDYPWLYFCLFFPISTSKWWFLTSYIMLILISPVLNYGIKKLSNLELFLVIILMAFYNGIESWFGYNNNGSSLCTFLYLYLLGAWWHENKSWLLCKFGNKPLFISILICPIFIFLVCFMYISSGHTGHIMA